MTARLRFRNPLKKPSYLFEDTMKKALLIMTLSTLAAGCADNSIPRADLPELDTSNPLLAEWKTPHATPHRFFPAVTGSSFPAASEAAESRV